MEKKIVANDILTTVAFVGFDDTSNKLRKFDGTFVPGQKLEMELNDMWNILNDIEEKL